MTARKPIIVGCSGETLSPREAELFARSRPAGLILFGRNCAGPDQLKRLVGDFRQAVDHPDCLILVDQEGGRVARLGPPHWRELPPARVFGRMAESDFIEVAAALKLASAITANELLSVGINVNCAPVLDVPVEGASTVVGDRAFASDPELVGRLGRVAIDAMLAAGLLPVVKHIPGHGRATVDSHVDLPRVDADMETLCETDFLPFKTCADAPFAMTAHIVYEAIDGEAPATFSHRVIEEAIRGDIGFDGILLSDDITMGALSGTMGERARRALDAGCDLVVHCSGDLRETEEVLETASPLSEALAGRIEEALARVSEPEGFDLESAGRRLDALLKDWV